MAAKEVEEADSFGRNIIVNLCLVVVGDNVFYGSIDRCSMIRLDTMYRVEEFMRDVCNSHFSEDVEFHNTVALSRLLCLYYLLGFVP